MKKLLLSAITLFVLNAINIKAQPSDGRQFDPAAMKERQKLKIKEDLKTSDAQADSIATIQIEFMPKLRGMRGLQQEERATKMKKINDAFKARLKTALADDKLVEKVIEYQETQRKERMERMRNRE